MKNSRLGIIHRWVNTTSRVVILALVSISTTQVFGQAPSLLWTTNIGATLFAVDTQTNLYANSNGLVITLNGSGQALSTNLINPQQGRMQRDAAGNYYFCGITPAQFAGSVWTFTNPACFLAKYTSGGTLVWSNNFGPTGNIRDGGSGSPIISVTDMQLLNDGTIYAGFWYLVTSTSATSSMAKLDTSGTIFWVTNVSRGSFIGNDIPATVRFGPVTATNGTVIGYGYSSPAAGLLSRFDNNGNMVAMITSWNSGTLSQSGVSQTTYTKPCAISSGVYFNIEATSLVKRSVTTGALLSTLPIPVNSRSWVLATDPTDCVYVGADTNYLFRFDATGGLLWSLNLTSTIATAMIADSRGNRFFSTADGKLSRLVPDPTPQPPQILSVPETQVVRLGSNVNFSVTLNGSPTLYYQWRKDGTNLVGATATNYLISSVTTNHVGYYDIVVTNSYGSVTSTPPAALLIAPSLLSPYVGAVGLWGQQATLSVSAWGSGTLSYQWYKSGQAISDATNSTLVFPSVQISDAGAYSVVVTSAYGSVTNTPADLVVNPAEVSIALYAGITIHGTIGYNYGIEYATNLQNAVWQYLTNVTLSQPTEIWVDTSVPAAERARRFYRVTNQ